MLECVHVCPDRVQTMTFSPLEVMEMFLAQTGRSNSSDASALFLFPSGGFWVMQSLSMVFGPVATGDDWP